MFQFLQKKVSSVYILIMLTYMVCAQGQAAPTCEKLFNDSEVNSPSILGIQEISAEINSTFTFGANAIAYHVNNLSRDLGLVRELIFKSAIGAIGTTKSPKRSVEKAREVVEDLAKEFLIAGNDSSTLFKKLRKNKYKNKLNEISSFVEIGRQISAIFQNPEHETRNKTFMIQDLLATYGKDDNVLKDYRKIFQDLENHMGYYELRSGLLTEVNDIDLTQFSSENVIKIEELKSFRAVAEQIAAADLTLQLMGSGVLSSGSDGVKIKRFSEKSKKYVETNFMWLKSKRLLKAIDNISERMKNIVIGAASKDKLSVEALRKMDREILLREYVDKFRELHDRISKLEFVKPDIEQGLHEMRRELRSLLSVLLVAPAGLTTFEESAVLPSLKKMNFDGYKLKFPFAPVYASEDMVIRIPKGGIFYGSKLVREIGKIKDLNEKYNYYIQDFESLGYSKVSVDESMSPVVGSGTLSIFEEIERLVQVEAAHDKLSFKNHMEFCREKSDELIENEFLLQMADYLEGQSR